MKICSKIFFFTTAVKGRLAPGPVFANDDDAADAADAAAAVAERSAALIDAVTAYSRAFRASAVQHTCLCSRVRINRLPTTYSRFGALVPASTLACRVLGLSILRQKA